MTHRAVRTAIVVLVGLTVVTCAHALVPDLVTDRPDQIDVFVGSGLRGPTDDLFVGTGLSFRLPR